MKPTEPLHFHGHCYVLLAGNWMHPHAPVMRAQMQWYPERAMNLLDEIGYRPYVQSVVTESPWVIGLYDRERVFAVGDDGAWRRPNMQTYAASTDWIMNQLLHWPHSIAAQPLDGARGLKKYVREYAKYIKKAQKLYKTI
jgi:hypothetical protein